MRSAECGIRNAFGNFYSAFCTPNSELCEWRFFISKEARVNRRIRAPEVRLIDADGKQLGVYITAKAIELADNQGLDLVEVSPNAKPPVCKIMDYGKYKYEQTKKLKEAKKHQTVILLKEVKFRPTTDEHDFNFKVRNIQRFIEEGNKVKATVVFRGREMAYRDQGRRMLDNILGIIKEKSFLEVPPKMEGRQMMMIIAPTKAK